MHRSTGLQLFVEETCNVGQRDIAFVFQMFALYPHMNVRKNISYPLVSQGMKREEVKISVEDGVLTLKGERRFNDETKKENYYRIERSYGAFSRTFSLPPTVEADKIKAQMKEGLLEILLPKREEAKPKEIQIQVS